MSQSEFVSIFKCTPWLTKFLTRRGLKKADSRPLYEYHATSDEYTDLKRLLREIGQPEKLKHDKGYAACFTLFCSEWYRRDYGRDCKWSWDPIHAALNINLSHSELGLVVPKGLESFWERPIRFYESERRNFLGSLFSEGGLPFKLLKETDSRFQSVFSRILNQYEQASSLGYSTSMLVQMMVEKSSLPQGFREDTSIEFIARMAEQLISLVQLYDLSTHAEPVKELERVHPKWRDSFPIPLDDDTGTSFLNGLLRTASVENKPRQRKSKIIECFFSWSEQKPDALHTHISLPEEMVFPLLSEPSTTRFELAVCEDGEDVVSRLREHSPKLAWMMRRLDEIKAQSDDKVIIFTELRDIQRELQYAIHQRFGFKPYVINGDTSTTSSSANSRQKLIDAFQQQPGFGIIILSTVAVGFGVNVQKANHVIHFTRCWNPAKEDQATDRAYRIGQTKDVYVYYPTIKDSSMPTFEETLDALLQKRRALARDMLCAKGDLASEDFNQLLRS